MESKNNATLANRRDMLMMPGMGSAAALLVAFGYAPLTPIHRDLPYCIASAQSAMPMHRVVHASNRNRCLIVRVPDLIN